MTKLPILGILILMAFVIRGYVSLSSSEDVPASAPTQHVDPHVGYYQQHLLNMGLTAGNILVSSDVAGRKVRHAGEGGS